MFKKFLENLKKGCNINKKDNYGETSLHIAFYNFNLDNVKLLIEKGANIHANDNYSLKYASVFGYLNIIKLLIEKGADIHANNDYTLRISSRFGYLNIIKYLIEKGADIHVNNNYSLRIAFQNEHLDVIKYLIEKGADINSLNDQNVLLKLLNSKLIEYIINNINIKNNINYYLDKIKENKDYFISYYYHKLNKELSSEFKKELINKVNNINYKIILNIL